MLSDDCPLIASDLFSYTPRAVSSVAIHRYEIRLLRCRRWSLSIVSRAVVVLLASVRSLGISCVAACSSFVSLVFPLSADF